MTKYDPKSVAANLRAMRAKRGLTQEDVAHGIDKNTGSLGNWESGNTGFRFSDACRLADFYGVSLDEIRNGEKASAEAI